MNARRTLTVAMVVAAAVALLLPATGQAALPTPTRALVVPLKSFGPIEFGTTRAQVFNKWGSGGMCAHEGTTGQDTCVWPSPSPNDFPPEAAAVQLRGGKVCGMLMRAGTNFRTGTLTITRLRGWKTEEGIGLGSKMSDAKKLLGGRTVQRKNGVTTVLYPGTTSQSRNQLEGLEIYKDGCHVT